MRTEGKLPSGPPQGVGSGVCGWNSIVRSRLGEMTGECKREKKTTKH